MAACVFDQRLTHSTERARRIDKIVDSLAPRTRVTDRDREWSSGEVVPVISYCTKIVCQ